MKLIAGIIFTVFLIATCDTFGLKFSLNRDILTCEKIGVVCDCEDEKSIYYCSKVGDPKIKEGECGVDEYCDAQSKPTYCKPEKNPLCIDVPFVCTSAGLFPDPFICDKYHMCTASNEDRAMSCPNGYYFNIASGDCDIKTCDREQLDCTAPMDSNHTYPYDNTMYFTCVVEDGIKVPILYKCEKGKFDDTTKQCSDANEETTSPEITTSTPEETPDTPDSPTTPETTTPTPEETADTPDSPTTPETTTPTPEEATTTPDIPTTTPDDTTSTPEITTLPPSPTTPACDNRELYPDETDCYYYYDCRNGTALRRKCPPGYHFSKEKKKCDKGECTNPTTPTAVTTPTTPTIPSSTTPPPVTSAPPECESHKLYPDPDECHYYYDCRNGTALRRKCPTGYYFSKQLEKCDKGECRNSLYFLIPHKMTTAGLSATTENYQKCPGKELYAHETNCHHYYDCRSIKSYLRKCPPGYCFSQSVQSCVKGTCDCIHIYD